jgi:hypothetical protein
MSGCTSDENQKGRRQAGEAAKQKTTKSGTRTITDCPEPHTVEISSADVTQDEIQIRLEPQCKSGELTIELIGAPGTSNYTIINREQRTGGTTTRQFGVNSLTEGEYTQVRATWSVDGNPAIDTYEYHIRVLGVYRHSQYNIPSENQCTGEAVNAYVTDNSCNFTRTTFRRQFFDQVNLNGSGISINHGKIKKEDYCLRQQNAPDNAEDRTFRSGYNDEDFFTGPTGLPLSNTTVAAHKKHPFLKYRDRVYIHTRPQGVIKTVTDLCPACGEKINYRQLDNFTRNTACAGITDLGKFMTIKLF